MKGYREDREKTEKVGKEEWEAKELHRTNKIQGRTRQHWWSASISQSAQTNNEYMESLDVGSQHRIQTHKEAHTKGWAVTEEVRANPRQLPNLAEPGDKSDN